MPKTVEQEAATIIRRAKRILKKNGWTRGTLKNSQGQVRAVGALRLAAYNEIYPTSTSTKQQSYYNVAKEAIISCINQTLIPDWNDLEAQSEEDVQKAFNCAIKKLTTEQ